MPPPRKDPTVALCLGTYGDPRGVGVAYERGTRVLRGMGFVRWDYFQVATLARFAPYPKGQDQKPVQGYLAHKKPPPP